MITISERATDVIKTNYQILTRLMLAFKRGEPTIRNWIKNKDIRLTTPMAVAIIREESGLNESEILVSDEVVAAAV